VEQAAQTANLAEQYFVTYLFPGRSKKELLLGNFAYEEKIPL
jgi:hypothetical protein